MSSRFGYYEAIILEDAHIQSPTFKVTIPYLFTTREDKDDGAESITEDTTNNNAVINKDAGVNPVVKGTTIITALNHTDYTFQLKGDVFTMERSTGQTLQTLEDQGGIIIVPVTVNAPHYHKIRDPFKFYNFIFENLNNVKVKKGTKCYGFFINGENDPNRFAITRIEGVIPLNKGSAPKYEK